MAAMTPKIFCKNQIMLYNLLTMFFVQYLLLVFNFIVLQTLLLRRHLLVLFVAF